MTSRDADRPKFVTVIYKGVEIQVDAHAALGKRLDRAVDDFQEGEFAELRGVAWASIRTVVHSANEALAADVKESMVGKTIIFRFGEGGRIFDEGVYTTKYIQLRKRVREEEATK
jgi:hypothetical protein